MSLTELQQKEVRETLSSFGLSDVESRAYFVLLSGGQMTATPVAQALGVPSSSAQSILKRLVDHGVVELSKRKSRSVYGAKNPSVFKAILEQRLREMSDAIPLLKSLQGDNAENAAVTVYTRERATDIFNIALSSKSQQIHEIVSAADIQNVLGEKFHFTKRRLEKGVHLKSLRVESNEIKKYSAETHKKELRETKFLPKEMSFTVSMMFWDDDMTAFFMPEKEHLAWVVKSKSMNIAMHQFFEMFWSVSRKMDTSE